MGWSETLCRGFLLAATARGNRGSRHAIGGLCEKLALQYQATVERYLRLDVSARARLLHEIASDLHGSVPIDNDLPARAKALLATEVSKNIARDWLAMAGPVRASFRASDELRAALRRLSMLSRSRSRSQSIQVSEVQQAKAPCQE